MNVPVTEIEKPATQHRTFRDGDPVVLSPATAKANGIKPLFDKCGGYRMLTSFTLATLIHLGTLRFCRKFISDREDPLGRRVGQMMDAARSGRQHIVEGSERAAISQAAGAALTDIAWARFSELLGDLELFLADVGEVPWSLRSNEYRAVNRLIPEPFEYTLDIQHDYWVYFYRQKKAFDSWLENENPIIVVNTLIVLIRRTLALLGRQNRYQDETIPAHEGNRKHLSQRRKETRGAEADVSPICPECGHPMCLRKAKSGPHAGRFSGVAPRSPPARVPSVSGP